MMLEFACGYVGSLIGSSFLSASPELADKWEIIFFIIIYLSPAFLGCLLASDHSIYYGVCNIIISSSWGHMVDEVGGESGIISGRSCLWREKNEMEMAFLGHLRVRKSQVPRE